MSTVVLWKSKTSSLPRATKPSADDDESISFSDDEEDERQGDTDKEEVEGVRQQVEEKRDQQAGQKLCEEQHKKERHQVLSAWGPSFGLGSKFSSSNPQPPSANEASEGMSQTKETSVVSNEKQPSSSSSLSSASDGLLTPWFAVGGSPSFGNTSTPRVPRKRLNYKSQDVTDLTHRLTKRLREESQEYGHLSQSVLQYLRQPSSEQERKEQ